MTWNTCLTDLEGRASLRPTSEETSEPSLPQGAPDRVGVPGMASRRSQMADFSAALAARTGRSFSSYEDLHAYMRCPFPDVLVFPAEQSHARPRTSPVTRALSARTAHHVHTTHCTPA